MFYTNISKVGNFIYFRGYDDKGDRISKKIKYSPTIYLLSGKNKQTINSKYVTFKGERLDEFSPGNMHDYRTFIERYKDVPNFRMYGCENHIYSYIHQKFNKDIVYDESKIRIMYIDIEVECERGYSNTTDVTERINAITVKQNNTLIVFGYEEFTHKDALYIQCKDEMDLLRKFIFVVKKLDPDVITGWNIIPYDIPYIINRIKLILGEKDASKLSPINRISEKIVFLKNSSKEIQTYEIVGRSIIDYLELYRKHGTQNELESYALNYVSHLELEEKKLDYQEYGSLKHLYKNNYSKFLEYNIQDTLLIEKLENKKRLISMIISMAYLHKVNYEDTFKQTKMWDSLIYGHLLKKGIMIPVKLRMETKSKGYERSLC